ncbi:MAG: sigma-54 dependent transcriptional regulator [Candidatus Desulfatibia sp.]|uniref:sigma-54-dependent transcriptional regulator n=1 Tax=Candidatus Desulfatibia sp. TaxID=3101189 RepID=UPI002F30B0AE
MAKVLIIDDDKGLCYTLSGMVRKKGHDVTCAYTLKEGLEKASSGELDIVFLDVQMPDGDGLEQLPVIREVRSKPEVIIITGQGDPDGAELAIDSGAWDYIEKPVSMKEMTLPFIRALQYREEKILKKNSVLINREGIVGESRQIKLCLESVSYVSNSDSDAFITGETGTGKELFARAIHANSLRAGNNFVVVDCGALTETLVESILFGHEKGAFTGADKTQSGLIKQADKGMLFLDEVGELPMSIQSTFLRTLQEHSFRPIGAKEESKSDFRLIAATNRDLDQMVQAGKFRNDLLFRLRSITIDLPPLRKRPNDIKDLTLHYIRKFCDIHGLGIKGFSPEFLEALVAYRWPGNVRELVNALENALSVARNEPTLFPFHLPKKIRIKLARSSFSQQATNEAALKKNIEFPEPFPNLKSLIEKTEGQYFQALVSFTGGDIKEICRISGLSRAMAYSRLKKYNISRRL